MQTSDENSDMLDMLRDKYELLRVLRIKSWIGYIINSCINIKISETLKSKVGLGKQKKL